MKRRIVALASVLLLAAAFVVTTGDDACAQKKKGRGEAGSRKKDTEERARKDASGREAAVDSAQGARRIGDAGEQEKKQRQLREHAGDPADARGAKKRYRPRGLSDEQMRKWTNGAPPGWSRGRKTGWDGAGSPPGHRAGGDEATATRRYPARAAEWNDREKKEWDGRLESARERIREKAQADGRTPGEDVESAVISIEEAAQAGVPIEQAESAVGTAIDAGINGHGIEQMTRAMAYGAEQDVDAGELGLFVESRIKEGERDDDLATSIYEEVDRRHAMRQEQGEEKKPSWWRRVFKRN